MPRFHAISKGKECIIATKGNIITVKRCRKIKTKEPIKTSEILKSLGIKSY